MWRSNTPAVVRIEQRRAKQSVAALAFQVREVVITGMQEPKSGVLNPRRGISRSAPGESPAIDFGDLVNSIFVVVGDKEATVGSNDPKAEDLELGTTRMAPRPFLLPALLEVQQDAPSLLKRLIGRWF